MDVKNCKISVLVAYNDENVTLLLKTIIDFKFNAKIDIARDSSEFLKFSSMDKYDIIFLGATISKDPFVLINEVHSSTINGDTPLVLFASYMTEYIYNMSLKTGIYDFLIKPFSLIQIYSLVNQILYNKGFRDELKSVRRFVRFDRRLPIRYTVTDSLFSEKIKDKMISLENISIGGLCMSDNLEVKKNDVFLFKIPLVTPFEKGIISAKGEVKWTGSINNDKKIIGVEFLDLPHHNKLRVSHALNVF